MSGHGFIEKRFDISPGEYVQLTDRGRKLKSAGSFEEYQKVIDEEEELKVEEKKRIRRLEETSVRTNRNMFLLTIVLAFSSLITAFHDFAETTKNEPISVVNIITISLLIAMLLAAVAIIIAILRKSE